jgi:hypothetical protein
MALHEQPPGRHIDPQAIMMRLRGLGINLQCPQYRPRSGLTARGTPPGWTI